MARHPYVPSFSFGNIVSVVTIVAAGVGVWVSLQVSLARAEERISSTEAKIVEVKSDASTRIDRVERKVDQLAEQQAAMNANLSMLLRSQGLRPVEVGSD